MSRLRRIYFDSKNYLKKETTFNKDNDIEFAKKLDMIVVDSVSFKGYDPNTYCDIETCNRLYKKVSTRYLFTENKKKNNMLYPSHNPTANPGGLY